jgi:hypothetical protein
LINQEKFSDIKEQLNKPEFLTTLEEVWSSFPTQNYLLEQNYGEE